MQPSSTLIFSSASFLCCYTWSISSKSYGDGFSWVMETGQDGRRGLGPEWQTSPAASRVTEQPCSGSALITSHEEGPRKGGPNIAHSTFPERDTALVCVDVCGRHQHRTIKYTYRFVTWVTLLDTDASDRPARRTALVAAELHRYNVDIAALSETRLADEGSLTEVGGGYTFFWKGFPPNCPRIHGVGFATRTSLLHRLPETPVAIDERLMTLRIPLAKGRYMTVLSAYAPTLTSDESSKDRFYDNLRSTLRTVSAPDKIALLGDFNARVRSNHHISNRVIGKHSVGNVNSNGQRLLNLCSEFDLIITNTLFQQRNQRKTMWMHPRSKHWHLLDYVIVRRSDRRDVQLTHAMRRAECWTDHRLIRASIQLNIRLPIRKRQPKNRLHVRGCRDQSKVDLLRENIHAKLQSHLDSDP